MSNSQNYIEGETHSQRVERFTNEARAKIAEERKQREATDLARLRAEMRAGYPGDDAEFAKAWPAMLATWRTSQAMNSIQERKNQFRNTLRNNF